MENSNGNSNLATVSNFAMFQRPAKVGVKLFGSPVKIKTNCASKGQFTDSDSRFISNEMKMAVINSNVVFGKFFKDYPPQDWRELIFVNSDDAVCVTLIKGESMTNFESCIQSILIKNLAVAECIITAKFESRRSGEGKEYSAVKFSFEENTAEKKQELIDFVTANPEIMEYSYLLEMKHNKDKVDTNTGEDLEYSQEIKENGNMGTKTDGFNQEIKS